MHNIIKKSIILIVAITLVFSQNVTIFATDDTVSIEDEAKKNEIVVTPNNTNALVLMDSGAQSPKGTPGEVVTVVLTMAVNREYLPSERYMLRNITIAPDIPKDTSVSAWPFDVINASYIRHLDDMSYNSTADVYYKFKISEFATEGVYPVNFTVNATVWRDDMVNGTSVTEDVKFNLSVWVTVIGDGVRSGVTTSFGPLQLAGYDDVGATINSSVATPGQTAKLKVPVVNKGGFLTDVTISPVVSASLDEFPFVAENVNYGRSFSDWKQKDIKTLEYSFKISKYATSGNKPVTFKATYYENGKAGECTFQVYIYIKNGYEDIPTTAPSLMVTGYKLFVNETEVSGLMAGDNALLRLTITNNATSDTAWKNVATLTLADSKTLTYTAGSSDAAYARCIKPGESVNLDYNIAVRSSAEVGATSVGITMTCETADAVAGKATQTITIPISQPMNIVIDEPVIYGTSVSDKPTAVSINMVNMGRAKAMNLQIVGTDGISVVENYYGGDLLPGGSVSADIQVNSEKIGDFTGKLIVSYEDANGQIYAQDVLLPISVIDSAAALSTAVEETNEIEKKFSPWWMWVIIILVILLIVVAAILLILRIKKRKASEISDTFNLNYISEDNDKDTDRSDVK